jgi:hypothetical protein
MHTTPNAANGNALRNASQRLDLTLLVNVDSTFSFETMTASFLSISAEECS